MVRRTSDWRDELGRWLKPFLDRLGHKARRQMCPLYVSGLIGPGDRKSIQPMAKRLALGECDQLHHFIAAGVWDATPVETELLIQADRLVGVDDAVLAIDDTAIPKKGPTATLAAAKGRLIRCTVPGSNIARSCQPALSGRSSPIVNRSGAIVRASGGAGIRNAGEADADCRSPSGGARWLDVLDAELLRPACEEFIEFRLGRLNNLDLEHLYQPVD